MLKSAQLQSTDATVGQWKPHLPEGEWRNIGYHQGAPNSRYRQLSRTCTYVLRHCRLVSHGDDGGVGITIIINQSRKRSRDDFISQSTDSPSRFVKQLEHGSDKPRFQVFYVDNGCAMALRAIQGHPVIDICPDVMQRNTLGDADAPKSPHRTTFCSASLILERGLLPGVASGCGSGRGDLFSSALLSPYGREVAREERMHLLCARLERSPLQAASTCRSYLAHQMGKS